MARKKLYAFDFCQLFKVLAKVKEQEEIVDSWSIWKQTREQQKPIYFLIERRDGGGGLVSVDCDRFLKDF